MMHRSVRPASVDLTQVVIQNDTVRRFGVAIALNGSTYSVGENAGSIYLTITLSSDIVYFMKYYAIGESAWHACIICTYIHMFYVYNTYTVPQYNRCRTYAYVHSTTHI